MIVGHGSGVKVLREEGSVETFIGDLTMEAVRHVIDADLLEVCETHKGNVMLIDENGKPRGKGMNLMASMLYKYGYTKDGHFIDHIVGDVVFVSRNIWEMLNGEDDEYD